MEEGHYRCSVTVIKRSAGHSAVAAAAYRSGSRLTDERSDKVQDYSRRKGVAHSEIMTPEKAPAWMQERETLWNHIEGLEKRKDAQLAREVVVSLPHQLDEAGRLQLTRDFVKDNFTRRGMVADVAIHRPSDDGDTRNHHAHILLTLRQVEEDGFRRTKTREWNSEDFLRGVRASWAEHVNGAYRQAGQAITVDHRSYKDRKDERTPTVHLGKTRSNLARKGVPLPERRRELSPKAKAYRQTYQASTPQKRRWMNHPRSPWAKARREYQYQRKARTFHVDRALHNWVMLRNRAFWGDQQAKNCLGQWHVINGERQKAERKLWGMKKRREEMFHGNFKNGALAMQRFSKLTDLIGREKAIETLRRSPMKFGTPARSGWFVVSGRWEGMDDLVRSLSDVDGERMLTGRVQTLSEAVEKIRRSLTFREWKARSELSRSQTYEVNYLGLLTQSVANSQNRAVQREVGRLQEPVPPRQLLADAGQRRAKVERERGGMDRQREREHVRTEIKFGQKC